jgi:hypothetical protein
VLAQIPLFLIGATIHREIRSCGEELLRIVVRKAGRHYYDIAIYTGSIRRVIRAGVRQAMPGAAPPAPAGDGA